LGLLAGFFIFPKNPHPNSSQIQPNLKKNHENETQRNFWVFLSIQIIEVRKVGKIFPNHWSVNNWISFLISNII
jgi:hypothetical protein